MEIQDEFNKMMGFVPYEDYEQLKKENEELKELWEQSLNDADHLDDAKMYFQNYIKIPKEGE